MRRVWATSICRGRAATRFPFSNKQINTPGFIRLHSIPRACRNTLSERQYDDSALQQLQIEQHWAHPDGRGIDVVCGSSSVISPILLTLRTTKSCCQPFMSSSCLPLVSSMNFITNNNEIKANAA
jgi:hypothetical protein